MLKQAEGELAFERLQRGSEGFLRWFSFQRSWLEGDLLHFSLPDDELELFALTTPQRSAEQAGRTPLHQATLWAMQMVGAGKKQEARDSIQKALALARELNDRPVAALLLGALGVQYGVAGMWEECASCSKQAQESFHALEDRHNEMKAFLNLGAAQLHLLHPGEALESIRKGWYLASRFEGERAPAVALRKMGVAYLRVGDASYAKRVLEDALKYIQESGNHDEEAHICACLALTCLELGYTPKAVAHLEQAIHLARKLEDQALAQKYECFLGIAMAVAGKFRAAQQVFSQLQPAYLNRGGRALASQGEVNVALTHLFQGSLPMYVAHLRMGLDLAKENLTTHNRVQHLVDQFEQSLAGNPGEYEKIWNESTRLYLARIQTEE